MNIIKRWYREHKWKRARHNNFNYLREEWRGNIDLHGKYDVTVKRRFQSEDLYVDLYWVVTEYPDNYPAVEHSVYRRCNWDQVKQTIQKYEKKITEGTY